MGNVTVTEYNDKGEKLGTTVVENLGEEYLALAYIADGTDEEWDGRTEALLRRYECRRVCVQGLPLSHVHVPQ